MKQEYFEILLEKHDHDMRLIFEAVKNVPEMKDDLKALNLKLDNLQMDMDVVKSAVTHHSEAIYKLQKQLR